MLGHFVFGVTILTIVPSIAWARSNEIPTLDVRPVCRGIASQSACRQLRSDVTTLGLALGNAWKIEGPGMSSSNIGDLWHSRRREVSVDFGQTLG
jgi:hypothetical protein